VLARRAWRLMCRMCDITCGMGVGCEETDDLVLCGAQGGVLPFVNSASTSSFPSPSFSASSTSNVNLCTRGLTC
jgi:hypothetical protein